MSSPQEVQAQADDILWFHSIDLGDGVVTKGASVIQIPEDEFPSFAGRSVLDIGAWDGYYSFLAERGGASRVVALDHYAWGVDIAARHAYWNECKENGTLPDQSRDLTDFWNDDLPGRRGLEFAAATLGSKVETRLADFATTDLAELGVFDVVLYLGVLYHMKEPLTCLERVRSVTREVAVVETQAVHFPISPTRGSCSSIRVRSSTTTSATGTARPSPRSTPCAWPPGSRRSAPSPAHRTHRAPGPSPPGHDGDGVRAGPRHRCRPGASIPYRAIVHASV